MTMFDQDNFTSAVLDIVTQDYFKSAVLDINVLSITIVNWSDAFADDPDYNPSSYR